MMKRICSMILMLFMLAGLFSFPVSAKEIPEVIRGVTAEQVIFDDMYQLCEAVDGEDVSAIFQTVLVVYPDLVAMIKKNMEDDYVPNPSSKKVGDERYCYAVTMLMENPVFTDDLVKLAEKVSDGDVGKIYECVLEIYPDIIAALKKGLGNYSPNETASLPLGSIIHDDADDHTVLWVICAGIGGIAVGALSVYVIMKKKKEAVSDS